MREILFKGKRKDNGAWIEGSLILTTAVCQKAYIVDSCWCEHGKVTEEGFADFNWLNAFEVFPESVSEFTGLTDKNGKKIFEGDIAKGNEDIFTKDLIFTVVFDEYCRWMIVSTYGHYLLARNHEDVEVIGNIHDNPELLKGGE